MDNILHFDCATGLAIVRAMTTAEAAQLAALQAVPFVAPAAATATDVQTVRNAASGTGGVTLQQLAAAVARLLGI